MKLQTTSTLEFVKIFAKATKDLIQGSTGKQISVSRSALQISGVQMSGDIGAFVTFSGDYSGIMVLNFDGAAALEIVQDTLLLLGLPQEDVPSHFSNDEVRNNIGEVTNQVVGRCRTMVQDKFDLSARANIPAVVPITVAVSMSMATKEPTELECTRIAFTTAKRNRFYMELALEPILVSPLDI
jgi:CheY-specific phosphatase CheX